MKEFVSVCVMNMFRGGKIWVVVVVMLCSMGVLGVFFVYLLSG